MQKKLIVLAIAALASTSAFADVNVYGVADAALTNQTATGKKANLTMTSGGLSTSRLGVNASEDLGNGMKAIAVVEYKLDIENNAAPGVSSAGALAARKQMLALAGSFGTVATGYLQTTGYDFSGLFDPAAGSAVSSADFVHVSSLIQMSARAPHALAYISPDMGGLTFAYNHAFDVANTGAVAEGATTGNKTTADLFSVTYKAGPLAVGAVYAGTANEDTGYAKNTDMAVGASYDLTVVKLLASYQTNKVDSTTSKGTDNAVAIHAVAPVTATGTVVASYGKSTINSVAQSATVGNKSSFTVAYLESLSKTTTAYAAYEKGTVDATSSIDSSTLAFGLRKSF
jgi:predicted porin